jgi:hypothetical protein
MKTHDHIARSGTHTTMRARSRLLGLVVLGSLVVQDGVGLATGRPRATPSVAPGRAVPAPRPLVFETNRGQADPQVKFMARGAGYTAFLTSTEAVLTLHDGRPERAVVRSTALSREPASPASQSTAPAR